MSVQIAHPIIVLHSTSGKENRQLNTVTYVDKWNTKNTRAQTSSYGT